MGVTGNNKGQTMVEFALIITLFLAIIFGIVEFGRLWWYSNHVANSVRAAARSGAVYANSSSINPQYDVTSIKNWTETYANNEIIGYISTSSRGTGPGQFELDASIFPNRSTVARASGTTAKRGDILKVRAIFHYQILTGRIIPFFSETKDIKRTAAMPIE